MSFLHGTTPTLLEKNGTSTFDPCKVTLMNDTLVTRMNETGWSVKENDWVLCPRNGVRMVLVLTMYSHP
ncbi:hypothetical protein [Deinococcus sp. UYEF24]